MQIQMYTLHRVFEPSQEAVETLDALVPGHPLSDSPQMSLEACMRRSRCMAYTVTEARIGSMLGLFGMRRRPYYYQSCCSIRLVLASAIDMVLLGLRHICFNFSCEFSQDGAV